MDALQELLNKNSTHVYHIEHHRFRFNHYAHGVIALAKLGATDDKLQQFTNWYLPKLEDARPVTEAEKNTAVFADLKGKAQHYSVVRDHYISKLKEDYGGNLEELIKNEFSDLALGVSTGAFHGTIHVGYGYSVKNCLVICEGLAYLYHSYMPLQCDPTGIDDLEWKGTESPLDILKEIKEDQKLREGALQGEAKFLKTRGRFNGRTQALLTDFGNELLGYAIRIQLPPPIDSTALIDHVVLMAMQVYAMAKNTNDFFLLHGVTSAWAIKQIFHILPSDQARMKTIRGFLACLLATYVVENSPILDPARLKNEDANNYEWGQLVGKTFEGDKDEHVLKIVQICQDMANDNPKNDEFYKTVALVALDDPFSFTDGTQTYVP